MARVVGVAAVRVDVVGPVAVVVVQGAARVAVGVDPVAVPEVGVAVRAVVATAAAAMRAAVPAMIVEKGVISSRT